MPATVQRDRCHSAGRCRPTGSASESGSAVCSEAVTTAFAAHSEALSSAARGAHLGEHVWSRENLAWLLARTGPIARQVVRRRRHRGVARVPRHQALQARRPFLQARDLGRQLTVPCSQDLGKQALNLSQDGEVSVRRHGHS